MVAPNKSKITKAAVIGGGASVGGAAGVYGTSAAITQVVGWTWGVTAVGPTAGGAFAAA